jgi:DNA-binding MarR family transcriptional regulator
MDIVTIDTDRVEIAHGSTPGYLVWRLATQWRTAVDRELAPLGLTHAQYVFLASLKQLSASGPPTQRELCDHTGLDAVYVSKLARRLEAQGFISRADDAVDARAVRLSLTGRGMESIEPAISRVGALLDVLTAPLGGRDGRETMQLTEMLRSLLESAIGERDQG